MNSIEYRVRSGDTLSAIARRHNVTVEVLSLLNGISDGNRIWAGHVLLIPQEPQLAPRPQAPGARPLITKPQNTPVPSTQAPKRVPFERGKEIESFGRVRNGEGVNLRETPHPAGALKKRLPFNTRVFVSREFPGDWYFVTLDDGSFGYVYSKHVSIHPPEPWALLHKIKPNEGALQLVRQHYRWNAMPWGHDERFYVNVLVEANRDKALSGIYKPYANADWSQTQTRANHLVWIPSLDFARGLRGRVPSGSISNAVWQSARRAVEVTADYSLGAAPFAAGLIHGALESVWDLLTGIVDLVELIGNVVKSVFSGELLSDLKGLWEMVASLKAGELVNAGLKALLDRWNAPDFLRRWHFRGWLVGYALAELLMTVMTGAASLLKWAGKAGKLGKLIAKFPKVVKFAEQVTTVSKRIPDTTKKRLQGLVSRSSDEASTANKAKPVHSPKANKAGAQESSVAGENGELLETHQALTEPRPVPKKGHLRLRSDYDEHIIKRDFSVKRSKGIGGAHNKAEFMKYAHEVNIVKIDVHSSLPGVSRIHYQMPALDKAGKPSGGWRAEVFQKTVYDPAVISDERFLQLGRQAAAQAQSVGKLTREWEGVTPEGIKMRGYLDGTGAVRSFFFEI